MIGTTLSHYRILDELGRGGMGIVYKAEDTKLNRTVALKVLPASALGSEDDHARFYREAQAAAQLNHANIATVYEIDEAVSSDAPHGTQPSPFIAMEYIEGDTLTERIKESPLKIRDVIRIATEIANALGAAHDKNIVHRDVKSGNVMLTSKGTAKVLDFGLAKTAQSTILTQLGSTLGTVAYMSPEQAQSEEVDHRTDLWALGVVLYEMITGQLPFGGDYEQAIIYSILNEDPDPLTALRSDVPMELESIVDKCLTRDRELRYRAAADIAVDLARIEIKSSSRTRTASASMSRPVAEAEAPPKPGGPALRSWLIGVSGIIVGLGLGVFAMWATSPNEDGRMTTSPMQLSVSIAPLHDAQFPALSEGARYLAFVASDSSSQDRSLYVRDMSNGEITKILNSSGARRLSFSSDSRWLLFGTDSDIRKVLIPDGTPSILVNAPFAMSTWGPTGSVIYESDGPLRILDEGATVPRVLVPLDTAIGEILLDHPSRIGSLLLFTSVRQGTSSIGLFDLESGEREYILDNASQPRYSPSGHLIYSRLFRTTQLMARPYDLEKRQSLGPEVPIYDASLNGLYDFSETGVFVRGDELGRSFEARFRVVDQSGAGLMDIPIRAARRVTPSISPDRARLAMKEYDTSENRVRKPRIWLYDVNTWNSTPISSTERIASSPVSRDRHVYYIRASEDSAPAEIFIAPTNTAFCEAVRVPREGPFEPEVLQENVYCQSSIDVSFDESELVFVRAGADESSPMKVVSMNLTDSSETEVWSTLVARTKIIVALNPTAEYVAISTPVDSRSQLIVMTASGEGPWRVFEGAADILNWTADGEKIYFASGRSLYQVPVSTEGGFRTLNQPSVLFTRAGLITGFAPVPERNAIYLTDVGDSPGNALSESLLFITVNWFDELRRMAPVAER